MSEQNQFEQYAKLTETVLDPTVVYQNNEEKHYLWYPAEDIPHKEIVTGFIHRGRVAPVLPLPVWDKVDDVPTDLRKQLRNHDSEALYFISPLPIFKTVMADYGDWGVTDLTAVKNWEARDVWNLRIEDVFFPNGIADTYDDIVAQIQGADLPKQKTDVYRAIAADMLRGILVCRKYDTWLVDEAEANIEKSKSHAGYASTYTEPALRAMKRLGRERKDHAISQVATRQNDIVAALPEMIKGMAAQQGNALTPEALLQFASAIGDKLAEGVKDAIASASKQSAQPVQPTLNQGTQQKR